MYSVTKPKRKADCHQDRPHVAKGLCRYCYNHTEKELLLNLKKHLRKKYGITLEQFNCLANAQNNVCAVCMQECVTHGRLSVDHCHTTGKLRSLLCHFCNSALGKVKDNPDTLRRLAAYIEHHNVSRETDIFISKKAKSK